MTKIFYDTEFLEDGQTVDLISIGLVAENGASLYLVNSDFNQWAVKMHDWLPDNVWRHLPLAKQGVALTAEEEINRDYMDNATWLDTSHPAVVQKHVMAEKVKDFILSFPEPELWADHAATDHVAFYQLFGRMVDIPEGLPWFTHEFQTYLKYGSDAYLSGGPDPLQGYPEKEFVEHHSLADAQELRRKFFWTDPESFTGSDEEWDELFPGTEEIMGAPANESEA